MRKTRERVNSQENITNYMKITRPTIGELITQRAYYLEYNGLLSEGSLPINRDKNELRKLHLHIHGIGS